MVERSQAESGWRKRGAPDLKAWILRQKARLRLRSRLRELPSPGDLLIRGLHRFGYTLSSTGLGFIDAKSTVAAARQRGLSVCEYREQIEPDPRLKGRRDLIIDRLSALGVLTRASAVCEIGAGTGMYLERVVELCRPALYEVYEPDRGWAAFLREEYDGRHGCRVTCHAADGRTLRQTPSESIDLVHAHGVFIYVPMLSVVEYLQECVRVCRPGGRILFDCLVESTFSSMRAVDPWLARQWRFPVVIPQALLHDFAKRHGLQEVQTFAVPYGGGTSTYVVWRKPDRSATSHSAEGRSRLAARVPGVGDLSAQ